MYRFDHIEPAGLAPAPAAPEGWTVPPVNDLRSAITHISRGRSFFRASVLRKVSHAAIAGSPRFAANTKARKKRTGLTVARPAKG